MFTTYGCQWPFDIVLFALLGLLASAIGKRVQAVFAVYVCLCAFIALVQAWVSGFSLAYFSWPFLIIACALYWLPFWFVIWSRPSRSTADPVA
jgi:hypothetical protein